jgi:hypothetical protein
MALPTPLPTPFQHPSNGVLTHTPHTPLPVGRGKGALETPTPSNGKKGKAIMKLRWKRASENVWKSQTAAKRRYEIWRWDVRTYGGRPTGIVEYGVARFTSGKRRPRYIYSDRRLHTLKEAKALAQGHASGEVAASGFKRDIVNLARPLRILTPTDFFPT